MSVCTKNKKKKMSFAPHLKMYYSNLRQIKLNKKALSNLCHRVPTKIVISAIVHRIQIVISATNIKIINKMCISKTNSMYIK